MARPSNYEKKVKPYLKDIEKMSLIMSEEQMAGKLGVGYSTWCRYKRDYEELREAIKGGREQLVIDLKSTLIEKAKGFDYTETKIVRERDESGKLVVTKREEITKHAQPDVAAINLLLKNYDREEWANDPQMLEIRRKELELREKQINENNW